MAKKVTVEVELPETIHDQLKDIAEYSSDDWTFQEVLLQTIRNGLPPLLSKVPHAFHEELLAINKLGDRDLLRVIEGEMPLDESQKDEAHQKVDYDLLRRTYALSLLKWRGHPIPPPYEALIM